MVHRGAIRGVGLGDAHVLDDARPSDAGHHILVGAEAHDPEGAPGAGICGGQGGHGGIQVLAEAEDGQVGAAHPVRITVHEPHVRRISRVVRVNHQGRGPQRAVVVAGDVDVAGAGHIVDAVRGGEDGARLDYGAGAEEHIVPHLHPQLQDRRIRLSIVDRAKADRLGRGFVAGGVLSGFDPAFSTLRGEPEFARMLVEAYGGDAEPILEESSG